MKEGHLIGRLQGHVPGPLQQETALGDTARSGRLVPAESEDQNAEREGNQKVRSDHTPHHSAEAQ